MGTFARFFLHSLQALAVISPRARLLLGAVVAVDIFDLYLFARNVRYNTDIRPRLGKLGTLHNSRDIAHGTPAVFKVRPAEQL